MESISGRLLVNLVVIVPLLVFAAKECLGDVGRNTSFDQNYQFLFGDFHITKLDQGRIVQLLIDPSSGSGFSSKLDYFSGSFEIKIKLPPKSNGILTTFYLITGVKKGSQHNEIDFEFLGDDTLQTNVYVHDIGGREERIHLWFDATADFHSYKILWNPSTIIFFIDETPIRVFKNRKQEGIPFPDEYPMHIEATMWTTDWAGGPVNWNNGPFKAQYEEFGIDGCPSSSGFQGCQSPSLPWNQVHELNDMQMEAYREARRKYMVYDYCSDPNRQPAYPKECHNL